MRATPIAKLIAFYNQPKAIEVFQDPLKKVGTLID
jgi:hypothetical protein